MPASTRTAVLLFPLLVPLLAGLGLSGGCAPRQRPRAAATSPAGTPASLAAQAQEVFRDRCVSCHNPQKKKGGLSLDTHEALIAGGETGPAVIPGRSAESLLHLVLTGDERPRMPYREMPLEEKEIEIVRRWIDAGAPPLPAEDAAVAAGGVPVPDVDPRVPVLGAVAATAFDAAGIRLAAAGYRAVHLLDAATLAWKGRLDGHAGRVRALAFSPDGHWLAAGGGLPGRTGELRIWDVQNGRAARTLEGHADDIYAAAFSPSGDRLATSSYDRLIKIWNVTTGAEERTLKEHNDAVYALAFLSGGRHLVSAAGDRTLKIWDVTTGERLFTINDPLDAVFAVAVHPSGRRIAAAGADRILRVWAWDPDRHEAVLRRSTFAHGDAVLALAFAPDGRTLVTAAADRSVKIWDAEALTEERTLEPQTDWPMSLSVSRDGRRLAVGRYDGTLGLYDLTTDAPGRHVVLPAPPASPPSSGS